MVRALGTEHFDAVVDWVAFNAADAQRDIEMFEALADQVVFISSASVYDASRGPARITEASPVHNSRWRYAQDKIAAENLLLHAHQSTGFPVTIVRPSHTYSRSRVPLGHGGWTVVERMRAGKEVVVPGDGTSLWTLTHADDFAVGLIGLLGNPRAIGQAVHITSDEVLNWNEIFRVMASAAGTTARIVPIASAAIAAADATWGDALLGDMAYSKVFDNAKIRALVPDYSPQITFATGAREIVAWRDGSLGRRTADPAIDELMDRLIDRYRPAPLSDHTKSPVLGRA